MQAGALRPYERSLLTREPLRLHHADGRALPLEIDRWLNPADEADRTVIARAVAPVLDVGCGPGRIVAASVACGLLTLGIDIAKTAVAMTRGQGLNALRRNVFGRLPGEGRWATVVLLDGNIGIGGDPIRLLHRVRDVLAPTGRVLIETHPNPAADEQLIVRFAHTGAPLGPSFPWAHIGLAALRRYAGQLDFAVTEEWQAGGRTFAVLTPVAPAS
jgi:SAM-dependent methyltransferase